MGQLKQMLVDYDYDIDLPTLEPEMVLDDDMPDKEDWAVASLNSTLHELEVYKPYHYVKDLEEYSDRLTKLIQELKEPF